MPQRPNCKEMRKSALGMMWHLACLSVALSPAELWQLPALAWHLTSSSVLPWWLFLVKLPVCSIGCSRPDGANYRLDSRENFEFKHLDQMSVRSTSPICLYLHAEVCRRYASLIVCCTVHVGSSNMTAAEVPGRVGPCTANSPKQRALELDLAARYSLPAIGNIRRLCASLGTHVVVVFAVGLARHFVAATTQRQEICLRQCIGYLFCHAPLAYT